MFSFLGAERVLFAPMKSCERALFEEGCGVFHWGRFREY
jgi:hypothetical protein